MFIIRSFSEKKILLKREIFILVTDFTLRDFKIKLFNKFEKNKSKLNLFLT